MKGGVDGLGRVAEQNSKQGGKKPGSGPQRMLPSPAMPMQVAREFVASCGMHDGALTIRYWCNSWWTWRTTHWAEALPHTVRALLYSFTENAVYWRAGKDGMTDWSPDRRKIGDLLEALSAIVILSDDFEQPCWIDGRKTGPIVATRNGLLDVASRELHPHTPLYFGQVSVPFPYDPDAPEPTKWLDFLGELWPDEPDAIDVLGEWFGYIVSGRLDLHKMFLMVGPTRGGRGVIARIETALIGKRNVCGPTLNSLGAEFGLQPLLGKSLAVISDARSGGGKNSNVVVERLLSISGEDTLTVNRKYKDQFTGKLPVRLHIISNELPRLGDASSAIIGRLVLLLTTRSWLGKENHELEDELRKELTGILNWSLEGLRRLTVDNGNRFTRFAAADEAIATMRDLASPVGAFVRERCVLDATAEIPVDDLYGIYKTWAADGEYPKLSKAHFGRDLRAACPAVRKQRPRQKGGQQGGQDKRVHVYAGIRLREEKDEREDGSFNHEDDGDAG
jgi:putative DNA primase/helicase